MCLMLYIATAEELPLSSSPDLTIKAVDEPRQAVTQWFSLPHVRFIGAHTGCSCGFPSVVTEPPPLDYYEGLLDSKDRDDDLRSVNALLALLQQSGSSTVELYPVWDGDQSEAPKGVIEWQMRALVPERVFFNERFMHVVHQ
jgi:hypothetical protein